jgi:hypothetical protein
MEACLKSELPPASELESALRNGVIVAKLALFFAPEKIKEKNIYDLDEKVFKVCFACNRLFRGEGERGWISVDARCKWAYACRSTG